MTYLQLYREPHPQLQNLLMRFNAGRVTKEHALDELSNFEKDYPKVDIKEVEEARTFISQDAKCIGKGRST